MGETPLTPDIKAILGTLQYALSVDRCPLTAEEVDRLVRLADSADEMARLLLRIRESYRYTTSWTEDGEIATALRSAGVLP